MGNGDRKIYKTVDLPVDGPNVERPAFGNMDIGAKASNMGQRFHYQPHFSLWSSFSSPYRIDAVDQISNDIISTQAKVRD